ncbi:hypothetical protein KSP40_PGU012578 [Platanthera guangdongensis]|uniref:Uncharacterized protein n=1 Tax=Platanthera guangdongensis TaxID=2320717 RepID=A0ABR2MKZ0_9ASPA
MAWGREESSPEYIAGGSVVSGDAEGRYSTRRIVKSNCRTEEVEPGRFVRKCEKSEQLLRECAGRPPQVVESKTEHTEEDITNEVEQGLLPFEQNNLEPFTFPGLRSDLESIEREFTGGLSNFLDAAEKITSEVFNSFGIPSVRRSWPPLERTRPYADRQSENSPSEEMADSAFAELSGEIRDV